ncbi:MAG: PP2C family protein-serine/threonine phosphatase, partial [Nitrospinota bacterium]
RSRRGIFVTLQFLVLEVDSGAVTFANGGHPPFFWLRRREGKVSRRRKATGLPLGINAGAEYREGKLLLGPGDLLLCCTDGLLEARGSRGEAYGRSRLERVLLRRGRGGNELVQAIVKDLEGFTGDMPQRDDITLLALEWACDGKPD